MNCLSCTSPKYAKKLCRYHYYLANPLKRSSIAKKPVKINKVSAKRAKELRVYEKEKAAFFETVEHCEFPGCEVENIQLHHKAGRCGSLLTDRRYFAGLCFEHHRIIEENPVLAKSLGLSLSRLNVV